MTHSVPYGSQSTADEVLAGIDLARKRFLVTECDSDTAVATMCALAANGAEIVGLARTFELALAACRTAGMLATPMVCDLANPVSVAAASDAIRRLPGQWDAVIANATNAYRPTLRAPYGIEEGFLVDHVARFVLVNSLVDVVRDGTGRIVIVTGGAGIRHAPMEGIMFENLDGRQYYIPRRFQGQAALAASLYSKELSLRLASRGVAVNSMYVESTNAAVHNTRLRSLASIVPWLAGLIAKSSARSAATATMLAASPWVAGISGELWSRCQVVRGSSWLADCGLSLRLWEVSEQIGLRVYPTEPTVDTVREVIPELHARVTYIAGNSRGRLGLRAASPRQATTQGCHDEV